MNSSSEALGNTLLESVQALEISQKGQEASPKNLFFGLPREVRDQIYGHALGTESRTFQHEKFVLLSTLTAPTVTDAKQADATGLPSWMLANKQMCSETLEVLGQTHTFTALPHQHKNSRANRSLQSKVTSNSLVLHKNVIRKVALPRNEGSDKRKLDAIREFLRALRNLGVQDLCLEAEWKDNLSAPVYFGGIFGIGNLATSDLLKRQDRLYAPLRMTDVLDDFWNGRFRKITITITRTVYSHDKITFEGGRDAATEWAETLLGESKGATWEDLGEETRSKGPEEVAVGYFLLNNLCQKWTAVFEHKI